MIHTREEVIEREMREFELLDNLVANLTDEEWRLLVPRPESRDPWTIKDALAHITFWKADVARSSRKQRRPPEERGLEFHAFNRLIYLRWKDRDPQEVLAWHRQVHQDVLLALREAPEAWFSARQRSPQWPYDLDGHASYHRLRDIQKALNER